MNRLKFFLFTIKPGTVFSGVVATTPSDPFIEIDWNTGATGTATGTAYAPLVGNTVFFGSSAGGTDLGAARLRQWSPAGGNPATGTLKVGENGDVTPHIAAGDHITITSEMRLWSKPPRDVRDGTNVTHYADYDIVYTDQTDNWYPVAVPGVVSVVPLAGGNAEASLYGQDSYALAQGAGISTYSWVAYGSDEGTSSSEGTYAAPITFTYHAEGNYLISLTVTDTNGKSHTGYTWVIVYDPANPTLAFTDFDNASERFDFSRGGGTLDFDVYGNADISEFPHDAMIVHAYEGSMDTANGSVPHRENILFVGYITDINITQDAFDNVARITAKTIDGVMRNTPMFPTSLTDVASPSIWVEGDVLTVDKVAGYLSYWWSNLADIAPIRPMNYTAEVYRQDTGYKSLYDELDTLLQSAWGRVVVNQFGQVHLLRDYQLATTGSERALLSDSLGTMTSADWLSPLTIDAREDASTPTAFVEMSGVYYPGDNIKENVQEMFSAAPGEVPKNYGSRESQQGLILTTQDDLNRRNGLALARKSMPYYGIHMDIVNDDRFSIAKQQSVIIDIDPNDNNRGLQWMATAVPRGIRRRYDHDEGIVRSTIDFEPDASGQPGVTITRPSTPPVPDDTPPTGSVSGLMTAGSVYRWLNGETGWSSLVTGTNTYWLEKSAPAGSIFRFETGKIYRSIDYGSTWSDITPSTDPPNDSGDSPAPTVADVEFDYAGYSQDASGLLFAAANWQNGSSAWRYWVGMSDDDGVTWSWV